MIKSISEPRLLLLSDMWDSAKSEWVEYYLEVLHPYFDIHYYNVGGLGDVNYVIFRT